MPGTFVVLVTTRDLYPSAVTRVGRLITNVGRSCDCHGDFKSLGKICVSTYGDRSTSEVVFFEIHTSLGLQSRERIISAVLVITYRHTGNA